MNTEKNASATEGCARPTGYVARTTQAKLTLLQRLCLIFTRPELVVLINTPEADWAQPGQLYQWREGHPVYLLTGMRKAEPGPLGWCSELWGKRVPHSTPAEHSPL